jgi:hypothetical protein
MNILTTFQSLSKIEVALLIVLVLFVVLPIEVPEFLANMVDSSLGMLTIFIVTVYLFFNVNPIIAVIYVFVAYELLRRSSLRSGRVVIAKYTPTQAKKDAELKAMNPPVVETLEEEVVQKMAPIGRSDPGIFVSTSFKPVADKTNSASLYM